MTMTVMKEHCNLHFSSTIIVKDLGYHCIQIKILILRISILSRVPITLFISLFIFQVHHRSPDPRKKWYS